VRAPWAVLFLIAGIVALLLTSDGDDRSGDGEQLERRLSAQVVDVTDGDTIRVRASGDEEKVRYIGIDTPESAIPDQPSECFGDRAAAANRDLVAGRRVRLLLGAEQRDQYGRLLAYVYAGETFVNAELLRLGFARTLEIAPNTDFAERFARLQQAAANAGLGLWGAC
jgi:micrococcal nuclease